jgi:RNA polymerase sigma-70 factor (ECF subfamily)
LDDAWDSGERRKWELGCIERARSGDRQAFAELYEAFAPELFRRILMPRLGNRQAAEDALSETFRTMIERIHQYEDQGKSIWYWLARVAVNKATDMHRVKGRTQRALVSFEGLLAPLAAGPASPSDLVESRIERARLEERVGQVLERINPRYRRAIELRFLMDKPRQECAEVLDVKLGTFDVLILRALRAFRKEWEAAVAET